MHPIVAESIATDRVRRFHEQAEHRRAVQQARARVGSVTSPQRLGVRARLASRLLVAAARLDPAAVRRSLA